MNDDELNRALALFRESGRAWSEHWMDAPANPPAQARGWGGRFRLPVSLAAVVLVGAILLRAPAPNPRAAESPFVPIPFVEPPAPYERVAIARMELPVSALVAAGFQIPAAEPGSTVQAEILMGQDGRAHAIRLLKRSAN